MAFPVRLLMEPLQPRLACNAFKEPWNVVEFFAGIGGMHFALDLLGLPSKVIAAYEISPHACATYALNHSVEPRQVGICLCCAVLPPLHH